MKGFIDLVFNYKQKYYIIDWKTNLLGDKIDAYSEPAIVSSMMDHSYVLQYHLYAIALHRYLQLRIREYDYNSHFGGVFYIFTRGVRPEYGLSSGVYRDRPSYELIKALDDFLTKNTGAIHE